MNPTTLGTTTKGTTVNSTPSMDELDRLEREIVRGLLAYERRNRLIVDLVANGIRQADIARAINNVRSGMGAEPITPDAVAATLKRVKRKNA